MTTSAKYARTFSCPHCGGSLELRAPGHTVTLACQYCNSLIDVNTPEYKVIEAQKNAQKPTLPLGSRVQFDGHEWEIIGMQIKKDVKWKYSWEELLLYNPRYGFRWLSQYEGHFLLNEPLTSHFELHPTNQTQSWQKKYYKLYHKGHYETTYVLGEFYWRARVGDKGSFADYICPPYNLNVESNKEETAWTHGRYISRAELRAACKTIPHLKLPSVKGVAPSQPNPHKRTVRAMTLTCLLAVVALIVLQAISAIRAKEEVAFRSELNFTQRSTGFSIQGSASTDSFPTYISAPFGVTGETDNIEINTEMPGLSNNWAEVYYTLVNEQTGASFEVAENMEYYSGVDSEGSWSEGSQRASSLINNVPQGTYHLEIFVIMPQNGPKGLQVSVVRGVSPYGNFFLAVLVLCLLPVVYRIRSLLFERRRWAESDYNPYASGD
ncbi:MAG: DUF4178 domain-containing protein [Bacteroidetes bacterium]|nr:DUF4178 domain-containing protein [Bacteroidota bacterium]